MARTPKNPPTPPDAVPVAELVVTDPVPAPSIRFDNLGPVEYEPSPAEKAAREMLATTPLVTQLLTADESKSPLFRSLRDIDRIEDPDARLAAALDRLDSISKMALGRERTVGKDQHVILDPDCNAAVKVEEVAHRLLAIEPRKLLPKAPQLGVFDRPLQAVK